MNKIILAVALSLSLNTFADSKDRMLTFALSESTKVIITNANCPATYKDKYQKVAYAENAAGRKYLRGCWTNALVAKQEMIRIHWHDTPDTTESNTEFPADFFLMEKKEESKPVAKTEL